MVLYPTGLIWQNNHHHLYILDFPMKKNALRMNILHDKHQALLLYPRKQIQARSRMHRYRYFEVMVMVMGSLKQGQRILMY